MVKLFEDRVTALITDDDPVGLMLLEALLDSMGVETRSTGTVAGAKAMLKAFAPSIAILDVQLPDGDGTDILLAMRAANIMTATAFITASLGDFPFYKCSVIKPDMMFSKPLNEAVVREWVHKKAAEQGLRCSERSKAG